MIKKVFGLTRISKTYQGFAERMKKISLLIVKYVCVERPKWSIDNKKAQGKHSVHCNSKISATRFLVDTILSHQMRKGKPSILNKLRPEIDFSN